MPATVWIQCLGRIDCLHAVECVLDSAGVDVGVLAVQPPQPPGILIFDGISQELFERLRWLSRGGQERVLALATRSSLLTEDSVWRMLEAGASDVVAWDHGAEFVAQHVVARVKRWKAVDDIVNSPVVRDNLVGSSTPWSAVLRQAVEAARFGDTSLMILGESGTGKELLARLIHTLDSREPKKDLIVLDCTTVVPELSGSEFFGHERGSFTGAVSAREGVFELADGGTLFLDELSELPARLQSQLLRVIQEKTYKRVGGSVWRRTSFRLICASNKDLAHEVEEGRFRADLYYRIASCALRLPPLRERSDDILTLVAHFFAQFRPEHSPLPLDDLLRTFFLRRAYPGNVRELRQLVGRICDRHAGAGPVTVGDIPEDERPRAAGDTQLWDDLQLHHAVRRALAQGLSLKDISRAAAETAIRVAVGDEGGNLQRAARRLGVTDRALQIRRAGHRTVPLGIDAARGFTT